MKERDKVKSAMYYLFRGGKVEAAVLDTAEPVCSRAAAAIPSGTGDMALITLKGVRAEVVTTEANDNT